MGENNHYGIDQPHVSRLYVGGRDHVFVHDTTIFNVFLLFFSKLICLFLLPVRWVKITNIGLKLTEASLVYRTEPENKKKTVKEKKPRTKNRIC